MKKLKLRLDALREEMELLDLDDLNSFRGGTGGYYGYDTWSDFLDAAENGDVPDGTYFDNGTAGGYGVHGDAWMYANGGGGYGQYGQPGYGDYDWMQYVNNYQGDSVGIGYTDPTKRLSGWCAFYQIADVASMLGYSSKSFSTIKAAYGTKYDVFTGSTFTRNGVTTVTNFDGITTGPQFREFVKSEFPAGATKDLTTTGQIAANCGLPGIKVMATIGGTNGHAIEIIACMPSISHTTYTYKDPLTGDVKTEHNLSIDGDSVIAVKSASTASFN